MIKNKLPLFDYILTSLVFGLIIFGIIIIGSATKININQTSSEFKTQIIWFLTGIILMLITAFINYHLICKFYLIFYILNIFVLTLVLLIGGGNGVSRWLFGLQPSEFSKIFMIIFIAKFIEKNKDNINEPKNLIFLFFLTIIPIILIVLQPSLSASLVTLAILAFQLFAGNLDIKYIYRSLAVIIPVAIIFLIDLISGKYIIIGKFLNDYQLDRIVSALTFNLTSSDPSLYQTKNSVWAIGSGQLLGKGLYNGTVNQLSYLPESHNDFIFSVVGEEFGFIGCLLLLIVILLMLGRCVYIASKAIDMLGVLLVTGVVGMLSFQIFVNIGVATGILPNTGMPFPFLSYGGSSMWTNMIAIGLILNVGMTRPKNLFNGGGWFIKWI